MFLLTIKGHTFMEGNSKWTYYFKKNFEILSSQKPLGFELTEALRVKNSVTDWYSKENKTRGLIMLRTRNERCEIRFPILFLFFAGTIFSKNIN